MTDNIEVRACSGFYKKIEYFYWNIRRLVIVGVLAPMLGRK